jgi:CRISPR-associated Csx2 family protein
MARKVFISVLGTSVYKHCKYGVDDYVSEDVRYAQLATIDFLQKTSVESIDKCYILLTERARLRNWLDTKLEDGTLVHGLERCLEAWFPSLNVHPIPIPEGKNEEETWKLFDTLFACIEEGDCLYFDVTHGFRSLPMLVLVFGNYAKLLKNATVQSITYGNYEGRDDSSNTAPLVNLLPLSQLQDWTSASVSFLRNGNSTMLYDLAQALLTQRLRNEATRDDATKNLNTLIKAIHQEINNRQMCRGSELLKATQNAEIIKHFNLIDTSFIHALNPILSKLRADFDDFEPHFSPTNVFKAAVWCFENGLYQQAVTLFHENIKTVMCLQLTGCDWNKKEHREAIGSAFFIKQYTIQESDWRFHSKTEEGRLIERDIIISALSNPLFNQLTKSFTALNELRNDFNHSGIGNKNSRQALKIKSQLKALMESVLEIIENQPVQPVPFLQNDGPLLINLSNHPFADWGGNQRQAATVYGPCIDLPFPAVDAEADVEAIEQLCEETLCRVYALVAEYPNRAPITVHVMGENTLIVALVSRLQNEGYKCVASTSQRKSTPLNQRSKVVEFEFKRFREYPNL